MEVTQAEAPRRARWVIGSRDASAETILRKELGIGPLLAALLVQRGYTDAVSAEKFLNPKLDDLHDARLLPDYDAAVAEILGARERKELIFVHGDYDVDGVTSAALFNRFLKVIGCNVHTHVPHRMKEGYGIHRTAVESAKAMGAKLFLTCDCGVSAHEQVDLARAAGMKVVVTDHHTIGGDLPAADAIVNTHRPDSKYPFTELCGAGVVFRLCEGICREIDFPIDKYRRAFLDLAALGTIADVMPLVGENRVLAKFGLDLLSTTKKVGLQALMRVANVACGEGKTLTSYHVGFILGPRLNAAGRLDDAALSLKLLIETDLEAAGEIARQIEAINTERRQEQQRTIDEASEAVLAAEMHLRNVIVVAHPSWHPGVVGIVAGRLVEKFMRPAFVATIDEASQICRGSARTIPGFHLADAIRAHDHLFLSGGGHAAAAGCSFHAVRLPEILDALDAYAGTFLTEEDFAPSLKADMEIEPGEVTFESVDALQRMQPFGCENPEPSFVARNVNFAQIISTRNPAHVRLVLKHGPETTAQAIAFNLAERISESGAGANADLHFRPIIDEWQGNRSLKWKVQDYAEI